MIVLSAIDLVFGILSIILSQLAISIIATLASGATLIKAVKISKASKAEKVIKATTKAIPAVAAYVVKCIHNNQKEKMEMKKFLQKLGTALKNNPVTLVTSLLEAAFCGGCGYGLYELWIKNNEWFAYPWNYITTVVITLAVYAVLVVLTIYLGYDSKAFAAIRKLVNVLGGDRSVEALDELAAVVAKEQAAAEEEAKARAEKEAKDNEIKAKIMAEEKEREEKLWDAKIKAYLAAHPEETANGSDVVVGK